ncbi:MAG: pimeloyl-ACP methyl ester carboxylesterase [Planctomycetota bacterium]|jgi:pimeloyl-ACP methyl ester carboxylesterase
MLSTSARLASWLLLALLVSCNHVFYLPSKTLEGSPHDFGVDFVEQYVPGEGGARLHAWHLVPKIGSRRAVVVHFHGNFRNMAEHLPSTAWLTDLGYPVVMFDYRGFGQSEGEPERAQTIADGRAMLRSVLASRRYAGLDVIVFGQSLGGAIALPCIVAEREALCERLRGVVIEGAFDSYRSIAHQKIESYPTGSLVSGPLGWLLVSNGYEPIDAVQQLWMPTVFVYATGDDLVPFACGQRLAAASSARPTTFWRVESDHHLGTFQREGMWRQRLRAWLDLLLRPR